MSVLEIIESPEVTDLSNKTAGCQLYNLNRLIELSPDSMKLRKTLELYNASQKQVKQEFSRRQTDRTQQESPVSLKEFSKETQKYIHHIVEQKTAESFRQAHFDALTNLPNRAYFHQKLHDVILDSEHANFALLFLDLDGFKAINDNCSHQVGDELLKLVSARMQSAVREQDFISRLGGDEFCIIVSEDKLENLKVICQRIIAEVSRDYWIEGKEIRISTSIGVALFPQDAKFANELINRADQALYHSKHLGKKQASFYNPDFNSEPQQASNEQAELSMHDFEVQQRFWCDATEEHTLLELMSVLKNFPDTLALDELLSLKAVPNSLIMQWLWDTADFYLDMLPAGDYDLVGLKMSAKLLNNSGHLPVRALPNTLGFLTKEADSWGLYQDLALILTEKEWHLLDDQGLELLKILQDKGVKTYCQLQAPWAFDWSLIEQFTISGLALDLQAEQQLAEKSPSIQALFEQGVANFDLELWHLAD